MDRSHPRRMGDGLEPSTGRFNEYLEDQSIVGWGFGLMVHYSVFKQMPKCLSRSSKRRTSPITFILDQCKINRYVCTGNDRGPGHIICHYAELREKGIKGVNLQHLKTSLVLLGNAGVFKRSYPLKWEFTTRGAEIGHQTVASRSWNADVVCEIIQDCQPLGSKRGQEMLRMLTKETIWMNGKYCLRSIGRFAIALLVATNLELGLACETCCSGTRSLLWNHEELSPQVSIDTRSWLCGYADFLRKC